jgi:hypothetical protein
MVPAQVPPPGGTAADQRGSGEAKMALIDCDDSVLVVIDL